MADRLHKTNILCTYEEFLNERGETNEKAAAKIKWAKEKVDWFDPFITKKDQYLDFYNKDEITQINILVLIQTTTYPRIHSG